MLKLAMKHVSKIKTKTGTRYLYRRVVPERWRERVGKAELAKTLGHTEEEAIKAYDKVHKHYQQMFKALKPYEAVIGKPTFNQTRDGLRAFNQLADDERFRLSEDGNMAEWQEGEEEGRDMLADSILDQFSRDPITGEYEDIPEHEEALIKALFSGLDKTEYNIADAFEDYLKVKKEETPEKQHRQKVRYDRVLRYLAESLGDRKRVLRITRLDAQKVRDDLLDKGQKPTTVARYIDDIKAVLKFSTREMDINYNDKFSELPMPKHTVEQEQRLPLPDHIIAAVEVELEKRGEQTLFQLWTILKYTGARLSEITMLKVDEAHINTNMPYLEIKPRVGHPLKTKYSKRDLPLTQTPLAVVKDRLAVAIADDDEHLFQKFINPNGANNASQQLMRVIRKFTEDKRHGAHSLRHNFRDRGRERVPENLEVRNAIEGRTYSEGEGARYGSMKLEWLYAAMVKINRET